MPTVIHDPARGMVLVVRNDGQRAVLYAASPVCPTVLIDGRSHLWFKTTGEIIPVRPGNERDYQLNELYAYCNAGGPDYSGIETTRTCVAGLILVVNDEGWIREPPLPYNAAASLLVQEPIAGNVLLCPDGSIW